MKKILLVLIGILLITGCTSKNYIEKTTYDSFKEKVDNKETFIIEITKDGCPYCEEFEPVINKVTKKYKVKIYNMNITKLSESEFNKLYEKYEVKYTPTTMFFKDGEEILSSRIEGSVTDTRLENVLKRLNYIK